MEGSYIITKAEHGWMVRLDRYYYDGSKIRFDKIWCFNTLKEALEGIYELYNPPILAPEGTIVLGGNRE